MADNIPKLVAENRARYCELERNGSKQWRQCFCGERNWVYDQLWPVPERGYGRCLDKMLFVAETQERVSKMLDKMSKIQ